MIIINRKSISLAGILLITFVIIGFFACTSQDKPLPASSVADSSKQPTKTVKLNYQLKAEDKEVKVKLQENGFVVVPNRDHLKLSQVYRNCKYNRTPIFITSDSMLHTSHLIFDWYLRYLEIAHLRGDLVRLTDALLAKSYKYYEASEAGLLKEAALKNAVYFTIGKQLLVGGKLTDIPGDIKKTIESEVALIEKHEGFASSPLMGYKEDYSQYVPRGHYDRSKEFKGYFKAMMWYGRINFPLKSDSQTLQALLICRALNDTMVKGETAAAVWKRIYETTAFFSGKADDLTLMDYNKIIRQVYGENNPLNSLGDKNKLKQAKEKLKKLKSPRILSTEAIDGEDWTELLQGFRLMGQRFTFDSYIFQNLVFNKVRDYTGEQPPPFTAVKTRGIYVRAFARGLDIGAVMGSPEAYKTLQEDGDTSYKGYEKQLAHLKKECKKEQKQKDDLYNGRLWLISQVLSPPEKKAPEFMHTPAWAYKQLNTAMGAWTELKHDTILYSKQPYAMEQRALSSMTKGGGPQPTPSVVKGYVEPSGNIYKNLRSLFKKLREKLASLNFPEDGALNGNIVQFEKVLQTLEIISGKELAGAPLSESEYEFIENFGRTLEGSLRFGHYYDITENFSTREDDSMPIIADVLTDVNSKMVLEEATGPPFYIFTEVEIEKEKRLCKGAVYSYYEFKWPMHDRLTDKRWREMLKENKAPSLPRWTSHFMAWGRAE